MGTLFLRFPWRRDRHFTWSSEPREGLTACSAKEVPSFLSHFKTLSNGPAPGIEPATSRSAIKRSTDWANPATVKLFKMAQKMQTYDEMSTTKGHPLVPQESQDYVLRSPYVERNKRE